MDFGLTLQTDPPAWRLVELFAHAEKLGFTHAWTFDSHILWQEPYVIYSQILSATERMVVGPLVTNPATRAPSPPRCSRRSTTCSATARSARSVAATPRA